MKFVGILLLNLLISFNLCAEKKETYFESLKKTINNGVGKTKEKIKGHSVGLVTEKMMVSDQVLDQEIVIYNTGVNFYYNYSQNNTLITGLKKGISTDNVNYNNQSEDVSLDYLFSLTNKYNLKLNNKLSLELQAGVNYFSFSVKDKNCKEFSPLLGMALKYNFNAKTELVFGVNKYYQKSDFDINGFNMEIRYTF